MSVTIHPPYSIAIFGGTFDPVHNGHILTSLSIQSAFQFDAFYLLPCKMPMLKAQTAANASQRIEMLQLAIQNHDALKLDLREVERNSPSYMVDTLSSLRDEHKKESITLIMGYDAFLTLPQWHQWKKIIKLANLLVINRSFFSNYPIPQPIQELLNLHQTKEKKEFMCRQSGLIYLFDAGDYKISSTEIRNDLKNKKQIDSRLPKEVYEYIKRNGLYSSREHV